MIVLPYQNDRYFEYFLKRSFRTYRSDYENQKNHDKMNAMFPNNVRNNFDQNDGHFGKKQLFWSKITVILVKRVIILTYHGHFSHK